MAGRSMVFGALAGALVISGGAVAANRAPAAPAKAAPYTAPRLAFGQPDLGGFWSSATLTPLGSAESTGS